MYLTIGVTGHRDLDLRDDARVREQVASVFQRLQADYPGLRLRLMTPLAEGADRLVSEVALSLSLPVIAVLPMRQGHYERDFASDGSLDEFRQLLASAEVIELPDLGGANPDSTSENGSSRELQYAQVGVFIASHCQVLLALWDGGPSEGLGGTADVVHYHMHNVMPGYIDEVEGAHLLAENENDLVCHLPCRRSGGRLATGLSDRIRWLNSQGGGEVYEDMPAEYHDLFQRLESFSIDARRYADSAMAYASPPENSLLRDPPEAPARGAQEVDRLFCVADRLAIRYQGHVARSLLATHVLAVLMGTTFIYYSEYGGPDILVSVFLALFFAGFALYLVGNRRQWHRKYLDYRALAEGLRVQCYLGQAGAVSAHSPVFAYDSFLQNQDVELGWIRHVMRSASLWRDRLRPVGSEWRQWVIGEWVGEGERGRGQLDYYHRRLVEKADNFQRTQNVGAICLWSGIAIALLLALAGHHFSESQRHGFLLAMGVLPLIAGVRDAYSNRKADKELLKQYGFMSRVFAKARRLLERTDNPTEQQRILRALGRAALEEHAEWILTHRDRPVDHGRL